MRPGCRARWHRRQLHPACRIDRSRSAGLRKRRHAPSCASAPPGSGGQQHHRGTCCPLFTRTARLAVGSRWRRHAWSPEDLSQGPWPANHATHWPLLQAHPLCTEKAKKLELLGPSQLGCFTGVLAPDSPKVEGPDPPLWHPMVAKAGGRWVQRNGTWSNKRQHESCNKMHECIDNTRCICALFCFSQDQFLKFAMKNNNKF
jgi:hypothetical protein